MGSCPLPAVARKDLYQGVRSLVPKCRAAGCPFPDSDLDTDHMPGGCILLVAALLDPERPKKDG